MTTLSSWAAALGLRVPIVCAPMGGVAGGELASAVSRAGALGMIGMGSASSSQALSRELAHIDTGGAPFGVGFVGWRLALDPHMLDLALAARATVISVSFLDWHDAAHTEWVEKVQRAGAQAVTQVATADEARRAADLGVDAIVARGYEAGGHGDHQRPRRALLEEVLSVTTLPVLSAGAISSSADVAAAVDAGAAAAWVGTAFSACTESLVSQQARQVLFAAEGEHTVVSRVLDVALGRSWPERFPERLLQTEFVAEWQGREDELAADEEAKASFRAAVAAEAYSIVPLDAGMGVSELREERAAAEVVGALWPRK